MLAALGVGLSLLGCRPRPPTADPLRVTASPPAASTTATGDLDDTDSTTPEGPFDFATALLSDTRLFIGFADPLSTADALGRHELVERLASEYAKFTNGSRDSLGFDLGSPEELADFGLAPHGPGGFALLGIAGAAEAFLFSVADRRTLRAQLYESSDEDPAVERFGAVELLRGPQGSGVVVERGVAILIRDWDDAKTVAQRLAGAAGRERLDRSPSFRTAAFGLSRDADAVLFVDVPRFLDEGSAEARLLEGLEGLGVTARIFADHADVEVEVVLRAGSPLHAVAATLRLPPPHGSALERFGDAPPVTALALAFEPESALAATKRLFEGALELDDAEVEVFEGVGGLLPYLTGEFGVMCRPALEPLSRCHEWERFFPTRCDETYVLGLRDPDGAQRFLERLASPAGGGVLTRAGRDFTGREIFGTFRFAVRGGTLVITEDVPGLTRLGQRWPEAATWSWSRAGERAPIEVRLELDLFLRELDDDIFVASPVAWVRQESPQEPAASRRRRRELDRLLAEQYRLECERAADSARLRLEAARGVGTATVSFSPSPVGLKGHVTVRPGGPSFGATWVAVADAIDAVRATRERESGAMAAVQARIEALTREIEAILSRTP